MRLLIDIGNTRLKWLCVDSDGMISNEVEPFAIAHQHDFPKTLKTCFGKGSPFEAHFSNVSIDQLVVSNVAGEVAAASLLEFAGKEWGVQPSFAHVQKEQLGISNSYEVLSELGVDRWLAIIGSRQVFPNGNVIVINCGTAITVDALNADNHFLGGAILPGFQLAAKALSKADGIAEFNLSFIQETAQKTTGTRTVECVRLGVIAACVGGVEFSVKKIISDMNVSTVNILLSGGAAGLFLDASKLECEYDANVIMRGLSEIVKCES